MKTLISSLSTRLLPTTDLAAAPGPEDIPFKEITSSPAYDDAPLVVYNPGDACAIVTAAILASERGWRCFKAGDSLPDAEQYIWLGVNPNRKLFDQPMMARKREHLVFMEGLHPMQASVGFSGKFHLSFTDWVYKHGKPRAMEFLVESALNEGAADKYMTVMELSRTFYEKFQHGQHKVMEDICPPAFVFRNVTAALYSLRSSVKFAVSGIDQSDIEKYSMAVKDVREALKDIRVATVYLNGEQSGKCCFTCIGDHFWLAKRAIQFAYPYYVNTFVCHNGMVVDTNTAKVPDQYADEIIVC